MKFLKKLTDVPRCDWCGRRAVTFRYRTMYADTVYENTSAYYECRRCARKPSDKIQAKKQNYTRSEKHGEVRKDDLPF